ncbi:MAG: class I SAM-dependent rRNA methyltransferase [Candidatus Omnitrophica bacterium]|nr:class I SAM-dependent rRNA methyltransferase [Candidatus Omnitrophota bacterium]
MPVTPRQVSVTPKGLRWWRTGHPWIYRDDIAKGDKSSAGELVRVVGPAGDVLGQYFFNPASKIALRLVSRDDAPVDRGVWEARLRAAIAYRQRVVRDSTAYRLIASEADGFPGLIVDRYGDVLVLQGTSLGIERLMPLLLELLQEAMHPTAIVARNDLAIRALEGLPREAALAAGERPGPIEIQEGPCRFMVDVWTGQKTGWYLDQRENRLAAARVARGRALDAFSYQGAFACHLARSAESVVAVDSSEAAVAKIAEHAALNGLANVTPVHAKAFDYLKRADQDGARFDTIVLDPPAFAKAKTDVPAATRGYKELNLRALKLLTPGGHLITCSCSHNLDEPAFLDLLRAAAADAGRTVRVVESRTQALDHPILLTLPESKYLKCYILEAA